ncbi:hypothetical protein Back11_46080 [Paenibacillus baekrokdamisoli]|uniref:Uncharacterized protein n=1 Tax=Paenibacillus baekrokdamisoli TaxID=1712516 RepID=A0A3G9JE62_9BACL|nr:DUF6516 family protein [Paenibacillus baekrokdamisoli]MBB3072393.1 hypothetical protein [Paenibacillus baekrokdamisoli]BBH23263.1 hypothetical protein Back11_46080 [Paenibacillus baekrokdamisoli]
MTQQRTLPTQLLPANLGNIFRKYEKWIEVYQNFRDKNSAHGDFFKSPKRIEIIFPLKEHPVHGITGLHVIERYDDHGYVREYQYMWKVIVPKIGVQLNHISSWGNEPHNAPGTNPKFITDTEPHHHHHVPGDRSQRKENWDVHTLEQAFEFIIPFLELGDPYPVSNS